MNHPQARSIVALLVAGIVSVGCESASRAPTGSPGGQTLGGGGPTSNPGQTANPSPAPSYAPLVITSTLNQVPLNQTATLSASGGRAPYSFSLVSGIGQINSQSGIFQAGLSVGSVTVRVTDSLSNRRDLQLSVIVGLPRTPNDLNVVQTNLKSNNSTDVKATLAWTIQTDCRSITVAVVDTGVDSGHYDLTGNILSGRNFVPATPNSNTADDHFHGTFVSGIIGGTSDNARGMAGICWRSSILPVKVLNADGAGPDSDVSDGIRYAVNSGARIINASLGSSSNSPLEQSAITYAEANNVLVIAAAGNDGTNNDVSPHYPSNYTNSNIISVAATAKDSNSLASFSNYGANSVHIAAPGTSIPSMVPRQVTNAMDEFGLRTGGAYYGLNGTSFAAPHVAAAAALIWSQNPSLSVSEVRSRILDRADTVVPNNKVQGGRRLNIYRALTNQ